MSLRPFNKVGYGLSDALTTIFPSPIAAQRAPLTADRGEVGQVWIDIPNNDSYVCTSTVAGSTNWQAIGGGGTGTFTDLDVTNDATVGNNVTVTAGDITVTAGNIILTAGDISANAGTITGLNIDALDEITAANSITTDAGNFIATAGGVTANAGAIIGLTVDALDEVTAVNEIRCTAGDFVAAGAGQGITLGGGARVVSGAGSPDTVVNAPQGSLYLRTDGSSTATRAYINTDGVTAWTNITTAA